ncbi:MAG: PTS sugar transporter subunit IIC [Lactobacillus sp.]|jgi:uncharacterized membrane protein|nr:PTS sugar transporter subunit IIC [Lactobacillus sp.]MCI2034256.1 PTS sugar transporter subunit IIC [Lactobacillus sp.]
MKNAKTVTMNILNGLSIGIIVALIPGAILNALVNALLPTWPQLGFITVFTGAAQTMMPLLSAVCVGMLAKFTPIQTTSLALAALIGAGNVTAAKTGFSLAGTGDIINTGITLAIGYVLILWLGNALKAYTILLMPSILLIVAGGLGHLTLGPVSAFTQAIGVVVKNLTVMQPIAMGILMGIAFGLLIVSPISTVGIATAITLAGIGAGSANLGVVGTQFALTVYGWSANSFGTSIAHFLGSPKMQMANIFSRPKLFLPILINAGIMGGLGAIFNIQGTPMSAGFGFAGLIGPLAALDGIGHTTAGSLIEVTLLFLIIPVALAIVSNILFTKIWHYQKASDYELDYA